MNSIVRRLQEKRQVEIAKEILESNGYKLKSLKESAVDKFWDLYDSDHTNQSRLEGIMNKLGIPQEEEGLSEEDASRILKSFEEKYGYKDREFEKCCSDLVKKLGFKEASTNYYNYYVKGSVAVFVVEEEDAKDLSRVLANHYV